jgi:hypothetical protein
MSTSSYTEEPTGQSSRRFKRRTNLTEKRVSKLAEFVARYIDCDVPIHNAVRSAFDGIDSFQRGGRFLKNEESAYWFNKKDINQPHLRELLLHDFPFVSDDARKLLNSGSPSQSLSDDAELVCEHVIPCGVLEKLLREQHKSNPLSAEAVLRFHRELYRRCIVTSDEDDQLSKRSMPLKWKIGDRVFARYDQAGFGWAANWF